MGAKGELMKNVSDDVVEAVAARICKADGHIWDDQTLPERRWYRGLASAGLDYLVGQGVVFLSVDELHELKNEAAAVRLLIHSRRGPARHPAGMSGQGLPGRRATGNQQG